VTHKITDVLRTDDDRRREPRVGLGSRLRARFAGIGLDHDIPELRGQPPVPATFEDSLFATPSPRSR
jgi:hypothetical protein